MARIKQTRRKSVGAVRGLPAEVIAAIAEASDISDPEAYERQHDEDLLRTTDPYYERMIDEDEDPEEVQAAEDTEVVDEDPDGEDPDETQAGDDTEGDDSETEAHAEEPVVDAIGSSGIHLPPLRTERAPTPPPLPLSPPIGVEDLTPEPQQVAIAPPADPTTPPHVPIEGIPVCVHNWVVGRLSSELAVAEARLAESRAELAAERAARIGRQGGGRSYAPRANRRMMTRIELRARIRVRALPTDEDGRVSRADAEEIFRRAMARVRTLVHIDDRFQ